MIIIAELEKDDATLVFISTKWGKLEEARKQAGLERNVIDQMELAGQGFDNLPEQEMAKLIATGKERRAKLLLEKVGDDDDDDDDDDDVNDDHHGEDDDENSMNVDGDY